MALTHGTQVRTLPPPPSPAPRAPFPQSVGSHSGPLALPRKQMVAKAAREFESRPHLQFHPPAPAFAATALGEKSFTEAAVPSPFASSE